MVIRLSPKASRPFPAAWLRAGIPREARSQLERSVEASIGHVSRAAGCHMPGSALAATPRDQTSGGGAKYGKAGARCGLSQRITKNRCYQPSFCTVDGKGPKWSYQPCHPCSSSKVPNVVGYGSSSSSSARSSGPRPARSARCSRPTMTRRAASSSRLVAAAARALLMGNAGERARYTDGYSLADCLLSICLSVCPSYTGTE